MTIEKKLKKLRLEHELTQSEMADKIGVSQPYYSAIEAGKKKAGKKLLDKVISAFKLNKEYFITKDSRIAQNNEDNGLMVEDMAAASVLKDTYLTRLSEGVEIAKNSEWKKTHKVASDYLSKVNFLYQRIVDIKILLRDFQEFEIKGGSYTAYEANIMHSVFKDGNKGILRLNYSTVDELKEFNKELSELIEQFEKRFFDLFRLLYRSVRTDIEWQGELSKTID